MLPTASILLLTIALTPGTTEPVGAAGAHSPLAGAATTMALDASAVTLPDGPLSGRAKLPAWMLDQSSARPSALPAMYATLGALQALDIYSTRRALNAGGTELNPVMRKSAGNSGAMMAVKALSTAGSIFFTERAWKKNRKGAVILMAVMNGVTAAVVANNLKQAR